MSTHPALFIPLSTLLLALPTPAQTVGGAYETTRSWNGPASFAVFGSSLSDVGDVNGDGFDDQIIGSPAFSNGGEASVYSGVDGSLLYVFNGAVAGDGHGHAVSGAGDVNADGFDDFAISSPFTQVGGLTQAGSVFVYSGVDGSLLYRWDGVSPFDRLGQSVSGAGDLNNDGFADILVGADFASPGGLAQAGSAFAYSGADGSLLYQWNGQAATDGFGYSVSAAGDTNGDGSDDIVIGSWRADAAGFADNGSAFLYSGADGSILQRWNGADSNFYFGWSVSGGEDIDGDGTSDILVGAWNAHSGSFFRNGACYAYSGATGNLLHEWSGEANDDSLGHSVSNAGDVNRDGFADVIVSSKNTSANGFDGNGAAYVYSGADGSLLHRWSGSESWIRIGDAVSGAGDANGDGYADVLVGSKDAFDPARQRTGSAFLHNFNPFLVADAQTLSVTTGGTISFDLNFPEAAAFDDYKILISAAGTGPSNYGVDIPLSQDSLVISTFQGNYPMPTTNMHGTLDVFGEASGSFTAPAGLPAGLIGATYFFAAIANQPGQLPEYSSAPSMMTMVL